MAADGRRGRSLRILITGAGGMLGHDLTRLARAAGHHVSALTRADLDVAQVGQIDGALAETRAEVVVNCAAFTDVDGAEQCEEEATMVNGVAAGQLAASAERAAAHLVHIGSDYVFPGVERVPRREGDELGPRSAYGRSKLFGERAIAAAGGRWTVVRSSWLYGAGGKNFVDTIRRRALEPGAELRVVDDQVGSPTWTVSLANAILFLIAAGPSGTVHFANRGQVSWYELACAIVVELARDVAVGTMSTEELGRPAPRPQFSALATDRYHELTGRVPLDWRAALRLYLGGAKDEFNERTDER